MIARLITILKKKETDPWSSMFSHAEFTINSEVHEFDNECILPSSITDLVTETHVNIVEKLDGYLGWDRHFVDDNTVHIIYYFNASSTEDAQAKFNGLQEIFHSTWNPLILALELDGEIPPYEIKRLVDTIDTLPVKGDTYNLPNMDLVIWDSTLNQP